MINPQAGARLAAPAGAPKAVSPAPAKKVAPPVSVIRSIAIFLMHLNRCGFLPPFTHLFQATPPQVQQAPATATPSSLKNGFPAFVYCCPCKYRSWLPFRIDMIVSYDALKAEKDAASSFGKTEDVLDSYSLIVQAMGQAAMLAIANGQPCPPELTALNARR